jgi:hypothetical protein
MRIQHVIWVTTGMLLQGCSHFSAIRYDQAEKTNTVRARLRTGKTVEGSVMKTDPYHLTILRKDRQVLSIQRDDILVIRRKPPVVDDFGKGISEEEIALASKKKNTVIYGIGGGALSFGFSFFAGSMLGRSSESGGALLAGTALTGTAAGTVLFIRAGKSLDRKEAIASIKGERRNLEAKPDEPKKNPEDIRRLVEAERKKREDARLQREELLQELEKARNEKQSN